MTDNIIDDAAKKMKNSQQDFEAKAETPKIMQKENPVPRL